jgi:outer membrane protein
VIKQTLALSALVLATATALPAAAQDVDKPWLLRFGAGNVYPLDSSEGVLGDNGLGLIEGDDGVNVQDAFGVTFSLSYAYTEHWAVTLLASLPFEHSIRGDGATEGLGKIAEATHLPPSLSLEYRFNPRGTVRPYIGAGLNWTIWLNSSTEPALTDALDGIIGGVTSTDINLSNSFGFAANAGIDWALSDNWSINTNVWWLDLSTRARIFVNGDQVARPKVKINPLVFSLGAAYRF